MAQESLRELLARVHEQLKAGGGRLDADARRLLATVMRDMDRALNEADRGLDEASAAVASHTPRLESLAVRFEVEHPALAETLRELIDALGKAGI
jgi:predicted component of type VI protein secretion system